MATGLLPPTAGERCIQNSPAARYPGSCLPGSDETRRLCMALRPAATAGHIHKDRAGPPVDHQRFAGDAGGYAAQSAFRASCRRSQAACFRTRRR